NIEKNKKEPKKNNFTSIVSVIIIAIIIASILPYLKDSEQFFDKEDVSLTEMEKKFKTEKYSEILIDGNKAYATYTGSGKIIDGILKIERDIIILPYTDSLKDLGLKNPNINTDIKVKDDTSAKFWAEIFPTILMFILFIIIAMFILGKMGGMANNAMTFGKSRAKLFDKDAEKVLFKDVAGAEEEKEELMEVVDFLKNPKKYKDLGAKIPKGTLLVGPPGTGKTLLARAVAGESDVPFLSISGSEFVEMFVGVGASRVRDLFENAKKMAPCIIFIDEIDAIGKKRGPGTGGGHDEREQTLNQILTEMDGFDNDTNVIVMGATNRVDVLDKALLRPGRFDRKITVNLPNLSDREQILKVHSRNKKLEDNIDFRSLASKTVGFSGADMGNLMNEAAIITARHNEKIISNSRITEAFERIVMGISKKSQVMNQQEKKITAYHEVGHAIVGKLLPNPDPVHKISIVSRGGALGVTWFLPERDTLLTTKAKYLDELSVLYGGRAAEEIFFGKENITTGASNDIERATKIARNMVTRFGMFEDIGAENFAGEIDNYSQTGLQPFVSPETIRAIDSKVKEILQNAYKIAIKLINENKDLHIKISKDLLEKEEINKEEFEKYFI
ncbi:MAG: ATP-dependent zinc metalloprotease FtsH, partial [Candidatus Gracilibacteria bacterium]|nr:ATP-dependent zinc metalloprotease FtsH [Candidatus Gracilibacteria bacterium]